MAGIAKLLAWPLLWLVLLLLVAGGNARGKEAQSSRHRESGMTSLLTVLPTSSGWNDTIVSFPALTRPTGEPKTRAAILP